MIDIEKTIEAADAEMKKFADAEVVLKFPLIKAVNLCSLVQLALRHPEIPEASRANGRKFCDELIELVGRASPLLADFMRLGDDPRLDTTKEMVAENKAPLDERLAKLTGSKEGITFPESVQAVCAHLHRMGLTYIEIGLDPKTKEIGWSFTPVKK
jgi:hypothetical protein